MRVSTSLLSRPAKVLAGIALVAGLWVLTAISAFVVFDRDTQALVIIGTSLAIFVAALVLAALKRWVDWETGLYALGTLVVLAGLYMIPLRDDLPDGARSLVTQHSQAHDDRYEFARALFWDLSERFTGPTREYLLQPGRVFLHKSARYYWETRGYMPSHLQTQLYRHMLLASGRFGEDELVYRTGRCFNSPHGYLEIAHPERELRADLWAAQSFEEYEFGQVVDMPSCDGLTAEAAPEGEGL